MIRADKLEIIPLGKKIVGPLSFTFENNTIILGANGSGKTSIVKALCGIYPYNGSLRVNGSEIRKLRNAEDIIANLPEIFSIGKTLGDVEYIFSEITDLDSSQMHDFLNEMGKLGIKEKPLSSLSQGEAKIAFTSLAFAMKRSITLLDEPFENLDRTRRQIMIDRINEIKGQTIIVTHETEVLKQLNGYSVFFLFGGKMLGPVDSQRLLKSKIIEGEVKNSIITLRNNNRIFSVVDENESGMDIFSSGTIDAIFREFN